MRQIVETTTVIPAGKQESSHRDVKLESATDVQSTTYATDGLPSMALDSGNPCRNDGIFVIMRIAGP